MNEKEVELEMTKEDGFYFLKIKGSPGFIGFGKSEAAAIDYALDNMNRCIARNARTQAAILGYKKQAEVKA